MNGPAGVPAGSSAASGLSAASAGSLPVGVDGIDGIDGIDGVDISTLPMCTIIYMTSTSISVVEQVPALDAIAVLDALRSAFTELGRGNAAQPPQTVTLLPGGGDVILYQGQLGATYSVKVSPYLPQTDGSAVVTAWTILLDTATGRPELLVDAAGLTVERTSATSALAVDLLARPDAATLAIIGSGAQARAHLRYARAVREFTDVRMFSRSLTQADAPEG
ncbi:hypothetical protein ACFQ9X_34360 [Catenulispora yoronensis]